MRTGFDRAPTFTSWNSIKHAQAVLPFAYHEYRDLVREMGGVDVERYLSKGRPSGSVWTLQYGGVGVASPTFFWNAMPRL